MRSILKWIPITKGHKCGLWSLKKWLLSWDAITLMWRHCNIFWSEKKTNAVKIPMKIWLYQMLKYLSTKFITESVMKVMIHYNFWKNDMYDLTHSLWVNTGWADGLFSVGIKPLPQAMLTNQHWGLVTHVGHFTGTYLSLMWVWNWLILKLGWHLLGASELSRSPCKYLHMELDYGGFFCVSWGSFY